MSGKLTITWNPAGFAEALQAVSDDVRAAAEEIADRATGYAEKGSGFHVELENVAKYKDSQYGVTRPVAYVVSNDDETAAEEAEHKILGKAL